MAKLLLLLAALSLPTLLIAGCGALVRAVFG